MCSFAVYFFILLIFFKFFFDVLWIKNNFRMSSSSSSLSEATRSRRRAREARHRRAGAPVVRAPARFDLLDSPAIVDLFWFVV